MFEIKYSLRKRFTDNVSLTIISPTGHWFAYPFITTHSCINFSIFFFFQFKIIFYGIHPYHALNLILNSLDQRCELEIWIKSSSNKEVKVLDEYELSKLPLVLLLFFLNHLKASSWHDSNRR